MDTADTRPDAGAPDAGPHGPTDAAGHHGPTDAGGGPVAGTQDE
jgi:hypothetical protein